jgi:hypothetical protein
MKEAVGNTSLVHFYNNYSPSVCITPAVSYIVVVKGKRHLKIIVTYHSD